MNRAKKKKKRNRQFIYYKGDRFTFLSASCPPLLGFFKNNRLFYAVQRADENLVGNLDIVAKV